MRTVSDKAGDALSTAGHQAQDVAISAAGSSAGMLVDPQEGVSRLKTGLRSIRPWLLATVFAAGFLLGRRSGRSA